MITVFSKEWFKKYNKWIVKLAKIPFIGEWVFRFKKYGHYFDINNLLEVQPNAVVEDMKLMWTKCVKVNGKWIAYDCTNKLHNRLIKKECKEKLLPTKRNHYFVRNEYALRLQKVFYPIWLLFHTWDIITRPIPQLNLGFDTLTQYPGSIGTNNPVDGYIDIANASLSWSDIRTQNGNLLSINTSPANLTWIKATSTSDKWNSLGRTIFLFDTSSLGVSSTISGVVMSIYGTSKYDAELNISPNIDIFTSNPASDNALVNADFITVGTTSQTGSPITYSNFSTSSYNNFTFNNTGIGNISKTGISKFAAANGNYDGANSAPTWTSNGDSSIFGKMSEDGSYKPKLVVTYTSVVGPANIKTYKGLAAASVKTCKGLAIASVKTKKGLN